jgi:hypothetical protein
MGMAAGFRRGHNYPGAATTNSRNIGILRATPKHAVAINREAWVQLKGERRVKAWEFINGDSLSVIKQPAYVNRSFQKGVNSVNGS